MRVERLVRVLVVLAVRGHPENGAALERQAARTGAGFAVCDEFPITPFVRVFVLGKVV